MWIHVSSSSDNAKNNNNHNHKQKSISNLIICVFMWTVYFKFYAVKKWSHLYFCVDMRKIPQNNCYKSCIIRRIEWILILLGNVWMCCYLLIYFFSACLLLFLILCLFFIARISLTFKRDCEWYLWLFIAGTKIRWKIWVLSFIRMNEWLEWFPYVFHFYFRVLIFIIYFLSLI